MNTISFKDLGLKEPMLSATEKLFFYHPTEIQKESIPKILKNKSIIGHSQTGSGKTHAYLLPLMNQIQDRDKTVQIVITAPTRELAIQIHEEVKTLTEFANKNDVWRSRLLIGGTDRERMIKQLENPPQIIIGTPGRILDMINDGVLSIYHAKSFVIDEADLMVEMNFIEVIDKILVRSHSTMQMLVFSATIPQTLQVFFKKYLKNPEYIQIKEALTPKTMTHHLIAVKHQNIADKIMQITRIIQPYVALIFVNSKEMANQLGAELRGRKLNVGVLHGGLSSRERTRMVKAIVDLKYEYIVATDLASRGIDIKGASHVINAELPKEIEFYIHRVGRTARAGLEGSAISFYTDEDVELISSLEKKGIKFQYSAVKDGEISEAKHYNKRALRKNVTTELDQEAWNRVKKPKKVKPGYKKKMKKEQERIKRKIKRQNHHR